MIAPAQLGLIACGRRFEDTLQRQQAFASQLDLFSGEPYVVAFRYRLFLELDAELVLFDSPSAGSLATHRSAHHGSIALIEVAPVDIIREFHAGEFGANLPAGELLEFQFGVGTCSECH